MDYQASQQIAQILQDLEPEDAIQILINNLQNYEAVAVRVMGRDDVISQIDEYYEDHTLTEEQIDLIADNVQQSFGWTSVLQDATEDDWDIINAEIQTAARNLGLSLD